jgi:hypothetical protein
MFFRRFPQTFFCPFRHLGTHTRILHPHLLAHLDLNQDCMEADDVTNLFLFFFTQPVNILP